MIEIAILPLWFLVPARVFALLLLLSGFFGATLAAWKCLLLRKTGTLIGLIGVLMASIALQMAMQMIASGGDIPRPHHTGWYIACSMIGWFAEVAGIWVLNIWLFRLGNRN